MDGTKPLVPPPPPEVDAPTSFAEVSIRTMASDRESIMKSGGGPPKAVVETVAAAGQGAARGERTLFWLWLLVAVVGVVALFFAGYFLLPFFFAEPPATPAAPAVGTLPTSTAAAPVFLGHRTFFRTPADEVVVMDLGGVSNAQGLQSYPQRLRTLIGDVHPSSTFVEFTIRKIDGQALSAGEFFFLADANVLDTTMMNDKFERDFTAFLYRDKVGFRAGYVFKLKGGPAMLRPDVSAVETATSSLANLFLDPPGNPIGGFRDAQVSGQPFRILPYNSGVALVYGWAFGNYLVLSTSEDGLKAAITHL